MSSATASAISQSSSDACAARLGRLRAAFAGAGIDALLISNDKDIRYLTTFSGHDSLLLVTESDALIITDPRYDEALNPWRTAGIAEVVLGVRHRLDRTVADLVSKHTLRSVGVQAEYVTVAARGKFADAAAGNLVDTTGLVGRLRMIKDASEVAAIERALGFQQAALKAALPQLQIGMSEMEFCAILEYEMKRRGSAAPSFDTMVLFGASAAAIHSSTSAAVKIGRGALLIDWGATADGYCSDMTRTFGIGEMPPKIAEIYKIVLEAQLAAIEFAGPGKRCADVDAVARSIITKAGYGAYFGHGLGHGLGLNIHEEPFFNDISTAVLEPGMVMTVEPGIYLPGVGGVRIEDDIVITESGNRVLPTFPKSLDHAIIEPASSAARPVAQGVLQ